MSAQKPNHCFEGKHGRKTSEDFLGDYSECAGRLPGNGVSGIDAEVCGYFGKGRKERTEMLFSGSVLAGKPAAARLFLLEK